MATAGIFSVCQAHHCGAFNHFDIQHVITINFTFSHSYLPALKKKKNFVVPNGILFPPLEIRVAYYNDGDDDNDGEDNTNCHNNMMMVMTMMIVLMMVTMITMVKTIQTVIIT